MDVFTLRKYMMSAFSGIKRLDKIDLSEDSANKDDLLQYLEEIRTDLQHALEDVESIYKANV